MLSSLHWQKASTFTGGEIMLATEKKRAGVCSMELVLLA